jgi:hypothetical protein
MLPIVAVVVGAPMSAVLSLTMTTDEGSVAPDGSFPYMVRLGAAVRAGFRPREMQTCRYRSEPGFTELGEW